MTETSTHEIFATCWKAVSVAALAVVVSLLYLGAQIQQNTRAVRAASYQEVASGVSDFQMLIAQNDSLARIYMQGMANPQKLSPEELVRFEMVIGQLFTKFDAAIYLFNQQMIDTYAITPYTHFIFTQLETPGVAAWWEKAQLFFSDDMRQYIDTMRNTRENR